jgi:hypothetical protein
MNFTQEQISELMLNIANSENGTNLLMQMTLNAFMKSECHLHQRENPDTYANGYRERKARGFGKEMVFIIEFSGLESGSYFVRITSDKGSATGNFLKE